jgi:hypothetical protein
VAGDRPLTVTSPELEIVTIPDAEFVADQVKALSKLEICKVNPPWVDIASPNVGVNVDLSDVIEGLVAEPFKNPVRVVVTVTVEEVSGGRFTTVIIPASEIVMLDRERKVQILPSVLELNGSPDPP